MVVRGPSLSQSQPITPETRIKETEARVGRTLFVVPEVTWSLLGDQNPGDHHLDRFKDRSQEEEAMDNVRNITNHET